MLNTKKVLLIVAVVLILIGLGVGGGLYLMRQDGMLSSDGTSESTAPGTAAPAGPVDTATYQILVTNATDVPLQDVSIFIYEDATRQELVNVLKTDEAGKAEFTDKALTTYVAVLDKLPTGYVAEDHYLLTGEVTKIVLQVGSMDKADLSGLKYKPGDPMMDFTVTDADGKEITLSNLFEGKKAVVLNFFYNTCQPCMMEFPYLQEAYEQYKDSVSVIAMNPVGDDVASIAALQKELEVTFPMVACDSVWESVMGITAYPTTVVIDRFGNICLIHVGSVPDAKTFCDTFAYFTSDEYEPKIITDITELLVPEEEGTADNPTEISGVNSFELTVEPGQVFYCNLFKAFNMYMELKSENAYVIYNGQTYKAQNGVVGLMVSSPDTFTPAKVGFGNSGKEKETFHVTLGALRGSFDNPYSMNPGQVDVNVAAGNEQGVYYTYVPTEDGTLTMKCLSVTSGVKYSYFLYNTETSAMRNLEADGTTDENGVATISVQAKKGQKIQICVSTLPDSNNAYPAAKFTFDVSFVAGEVTDIEKEELTEYTVTVLDTDNQPMTNVSVIVTAGEEQQAFTTDAEGKAIFSLTPGTYTGQIYIPDGYTAVNTAFTLTVEAPTAVLTVEKIQRADYTVTVKDPDGGAVAGVPVRIGSGAWLTTDAKGAATESLEPGTYQVMVMIPEGYSGEALHSFPENTTEITVILNYAPGSEKNPIVVTEYPFTTQKLDSGKQLYYCFPCAEGMTGIAICDADAYIRVGGTTVTANSDGIVEYAMGEATVLAIGNAGTARESYTVTDVYPVGSEQNPILVEDYPFTTPAMTAGQTLYYQFVQVQKVLGFTVADADILVTYVQTPYGPENGVLCYTFPEANTILAVTNNGSAEKAFTFTAIMPEEGTEENPEVLTAVGSVTMKLEAGDTDGYYYSYTTDKSGTLNLRLLQNIGVAYDVEMYTNVRYSLMSESGITRQVNIDMMAGETVIIHIFTQEGDTANFRMRTSFTEGEVLPPEEPVDPPTDPVDPPVEPPVEPPIEPPVEEPEFAYTYTVTVTDIFGGGQQNIGVMFMKDGIPVKVVNTDAQGKAVLGTDEEATYTVELVFTDKEYYYDKASAVLTPANKTLTVQLIANISFSDYTPIYILNDNPAYTLYVGGTRVQLGEGKRNFSAEYENNCFYVFTPQEAGTYQITVTPDVALSFWGTTNFINKLNENVTDNVITFSISGTSVKNTTYVIGVQVNGTVTDAVLNLARIGDPEFSIADQPWTEWQSNLPHTDVWKTETGLQAMPGEAYYDLPGTPTWIDISAVSGTYELYYDAENGYYRLGKDGPVILVNLHAANRFVSLYERVNGNGQYGGSAVTRYFFDETGKFLRKEAYTEYLQNCFAEMKLDAVSEKGYYPLTKDMMYVLQNGFCQWWDTTSPNYLEGFAGANPEYAWMFACCVA